MKVISKIFQTDDVAVVTVDKAPANTVFLSKLFGTVADNGINVDMISQTAPRGNKTSLSFTVNDDKTAKLLSVLNTLKEDGISTSVSVGNVKILLYGDEMPAKVGVAAGIFKRLSESNIEVLLITTSDVDISVVVSAADGDKALGLLRKAYLQM